MLALFAFVTGVARAQPVESSAALRLHSPVAGDIVEQGALFVVIEVADGVRLDPETMVLLVDDARVEAEPKVSNSLIRYLVQERLASGAHRLSFSARLPDGRPLASLEATFTVAGAPEPASTLSRSAPTIRGTTYLGSHNADISGNRQLRQQPLSTYLLRTDVTAQYGRFTFPVRAYLTTDETSRAQPRNRVLVGVESPWFIVHAGDTQPDYGPLSLAGSRTRGVLAEAIAPGVRLSVTHGRLRRAVDAVSLSDEPTVISPFQNTYRRDMTAARIAFGSPNTVALSLHGLKAADDTTSLSVGRRPLENIVGGSDLSIRLLGERIAFDAGSAMSLTTEDISRGSSDKAEIDSLFNVDIPIDPSDFSWLITLNPSTVPLRLDKLTSLAWYTSGRVVAGMHRVTAEYRSIGSTFFSAGNPFLINNRRSFSITDRFRFAADRLTGSARIYWYGSQPDDYGFDEPLSSTLYATNLTWRIGSDLPTLTTGLRYNTRNRGAEDAMTSDSRLASVTIGALHQFRTRTQTHTVQFTAGHTVREDRVNSSIDNHSTTLGLGLYEQLSERLSANIQVTLVSIGYPNLDIGQRWTSVGGGLTKRFRARPVSLAANGRLAHATASELLSGSNRYGGDVSASWDLQRNMTLELQLGIDAFRDETIEEARYTEKYVAVRHRYRF